MYIFCPIRVQSQVESNQKLKRKWYLIPPSLTFSIIRYISRVKRKNPGKGVAPSPTPQCSSYWKGSLQIALDYGHQLYFTHTHTHTHTYTLWAIYITREKGVAPSPTPQCSSYWKGSLQIALNYGHQLHRHTYTLWAIYITREKAII